MVAATKIIPSQVRGSVVHEESLTVTYTVSTVCCAWSITAVIKKVKKEMTFFIVLKNNRF